MFPLKLIGSVSVSCVRTPIQHVIVIWHVRECSLGIVWTERTMVRAMCGVRLIYR